MNRQCPFCEASISDEELANVAMPVCPSCKSSLPVEFWSSAMRGGSLRGPAAVPIEDEIAVDFPDLDIEPESKSDADSTDDPVIDEQAIDWLDEIDVPAAVPVTDPFETVRPSTMANEFQLDELTEKDNQLFELETSESAVARRESESVPYDPTESTMAWGDESPKPDIKKGHPRAAEPTSVDRAEGKPEVAVQPFQTTEAGGTMSKSTKKPKGILSRLVNGVALAGGLIGILAILQLICWWLIGVDPFNVAFMLPKSVAWLTPYALTEEGQRAAMQTKIRPTTGATPEELADQAAADEEASSSSEPDTSASEPALAAAESNESAQPPAPETPPEAESPLAGTESTDVSTPPESPQPSPDTPASSLADAGEPEPPAVPAEGESADPMAETDQGSEVAAETASPDTALPLAGTNATPEPENVAATDEPMPEESVPAEPASPPAEPTSPPEGDLLGDLGELAPEPAPADDLAPAAEPVEPASEPVTPAITNVPVYQVDDVRTALAAAERAADKLNEARRERVDVKTLTQTARDFYSSFCQLAEAATLVDTEQAKEELSRTRDLLTNLAQDASKLRMVGTTASGWIARKLGNGVIVAGTIESVQPVGRFQEVTLRPIGSDQPMTIVTAEPDTDTQQALGVGRNVLLAGYIVRDPEAQLPGFLAEEPTVVWLHDVVVATP